jgi:hypothetical protein
MITPLADAVQRPAKQDWRFLMLSALVLAVEADIAVLLWRHWRLWSRSPFPVIAVLIALAACLIWFWNRTNRHRKFLLSYSQEHTDPASIQLVERMSGALRDGLLVACMLPWLALMAIHLLLVR